MKTPGWASLITLLSDTAYPSFIGESGGVEHHHDTPPYPVSSSPTSGHSSALDDIFDLQDQVASSVVGAIEPRLRQSQIERSSRKPTESLDAYDLYLRALAQRDTHTDESVCEAIALLMRALAIDPNYAPAKAA